MEPQKTFIISNEQRFPWLTSDQIWRIEQLTKNYSWTQKLKVQQQLYQQAITQLKNQEVTDNRFALKNDIFCKSLDKDSKEKTTDQCNVRLEDLADIVKDKYHLNANTETNVVMNWIINMAKDKNVSTDLLNDYIDEWNKEFLYQMWFEERPIEEEKWTNWLKNIWYYLNPVWQLTSDVTNWAVNHPKESAEVWVWFAQSPWKRWYNIIWQWMDRLGKEVSDKLEWSALERYVKNAATKVFWEDAIKEYEQIQQQRVNKWSSILWDSAYYGREQSNIRTPLLWAERAESEYTKWWEMAWDLATAVALSSPMAAATAPYMWTESLWQAWLTALLWWSQWWLDMAAYEYWANQELATPWEIAFWMWAWAATPFVVPLWWKFLKWVNNKYNEINQLLKNSSKEQLWEELKTLFSKWVRPSSLWVKTTKAQEKIYDDALDAVETIINNKNNLKFTNANWEVIEWQLPKNSYEFAQAIDQTKKATFDQYIAMVWDAWKQTRVSVEDLTDELLKLKKDKAALLWNPWLENAIDNWLRWLREIEDLSVEQAQRKVQEINKKLEAFYKNPNPNDVSWNAIDALVKNKLNEWIDNAIDQTLWSSEEFEALKRAYWSLKTIEKDVNHRAIVAWRQSPNSLVDSIADISSVESLLDVLTWSPVWAVKALGKQALKKYVKNANSSDNMIRKLFEKANKWLEKSWTLKTRQQLLKQQQEQYNRWLNKWYNKNYLPYIEWSNDAWKTVIPSWKTIAVTPEWDAVREWQINEVNNIKNIDNTNKIVNEDWTPFMKSNEWKIEDKLATVREKAYKNVDTVMEEAKASWLEQWTAEYDKVVWEKLYNEFKDSFDDLLAEHMKNNPEKANLIDPDELRYLVNDNQRLPAWITHPIVKELAERQYKKVVSELMKSWKKNALVMWWWSWAWKWFVRKHYKLAENWFQDWRPADIIVDKVSWVEEANELVKKWFDVQQYWVIPRAENVVLNISQRAFEQWRWLSIPKVWRDAHLRFVDQFLNWRPNKWSVSPLELYANSLKWDWKYKLKLLWLRDNLVEVPWEWWFTKYVPEEWWKWAVEIPMSEWRKALEDYEKEIWVELSNDKIEKVVKEKFLDTWKIDKARYKELVTWISWLLLLWLANLGAEKEDA